MKPDPRKPSQPRIARWVCVALIIVSLIILGAYWSSRVANFASLEESSLKDMEQRAAALTSAVAEQTRSVVYNLDLALHHLQQEFVEKRRITDVDVRAVLGATPPGLVRRITYIDVAGVSRFSYPKPPQGVQINASDRPHFTVHAGGTKSGLFIGAPIRSRFDGEWLIPLSHKLTDARGKFAGVVLLAVAPEHFAEIYGRFAVGRDDVIALVRSDGAFLSRSVNLADHLGKVVRSDRPFVGDKAPESGGFRSISSHEPVDRVFAFRRLAEWPLTVVVGVGVKETLTPIREGRFKDLRAATMVSLLVLLLVAGVCVVLLRLERRLIQLGETEDRLALAFSGASEMAWEWNVGQKWAMFFGNCGPFLGLDVLQARILIDDWAERVHPDERDAVRLRIGKMLKAGDDSFEIEYRLRHADGSHRWILARGKTVGRDSGGRIERIIGVLLDIDDSKRAQLLAAKTQVSYARLIESVGEGIFVVNRSGCVEMINPAAERLLGWRIDEIRGLPAHEVFHQPLADEIRVDWPECPIAMTLADGAARRGQRLTYRRKDGTPAPVELSVAPIVLDGETTGAIVVFADIAERLSWEAELERLARTDMLTGVNNRRFFTEMVEREIHRAERENTPLAMLMLDLDHFKQINDSFGHPAGDAVLVTVARECLAELRQPDVFCRLGGEEFAAALPGISLTEAGRVAHRLRERIAALTIQYKETSISCTASVGVASWQVGDDVGDLLARADSLLYIAKDAGRNCVVSTDEQGVSVAMA